MSSKDSNEKQLVHSKTHNRELMFGLDMEDNHIIITYDEK